MPNSKRESTTGPAQPIYSTTASTVTLEGKVRGTVCQPVYSFWLIFTGGQLSFGTLREIEGEQWNKVSANHKDEYKYIYVIITANNERASSSYN